jgi:polyhydroxyalkanoate synthesis repressor PhaR
VIIIKRYPNRKLYNTEAKQYITLEGIADLIRQGIEIQVIDHTSGEDLTALTLTQIILEQEKRQSGLLTNSFLMGLIRAGGDRLSALHRSLHSPLQFWRQFDDEIKRRVQALVQQGDLSDKEGKTLLEKLIQQGLRSTRESQIITEEELERYLKQRQAPTQEDIRKLHQQLDELSIKIDQIRERGDHEK